MRLFHRRQGLVYVTLDWSDVTVAVPPDGKLELASAWEVWQFLRKIYKISGPRKLALDLLRSTEKSGSWAPPHLRSSKVTESMYKYLQTHIEVLKLCIIKSANK